MPSNKERMTIDITSNISGFLSNLRTLRTEISKIRLPESTGKSLETEFDRLTKSVQDFGQKTSTAVSLADMGKLSTSLNTIERNFKTLSATVSSLGALGNDQLLNLLPEETVRTIRSAESALKTFRSAIQQAETPTRELAQAQQRLNSLQEDFTKAQSKKQVSTDIYTKQEEQVNKLLTRLGEAQNRLTEIRKLYQSRGWNPDSTRANSNAVLGTQLEISSGELTSVREMTAEVERLQAQYLRASEAQSRMITTDDYQNLQIQVNRAAQEVSHLSNEFDSIRTERIETAFSDLRNSLSDIQGLDLTGINTVNDIGLLETRIQQLSDGALLEVRDRIDNWKTSLNNMGPQINSFRTTVDNANTSLETSAERARELGNVRQHILQFFGIEGAINVFRRAITDAFQTIQDLDAAMTETAVVTDFTVGDMWNEMPRYTEAANELGATTLGAYETMTLFYQQG